MKKLKEKLKKLLNSRTSRKDCIVYFYETNDTIRFRQFRSGLSVQFVVDCLITENPNMSYELESLLCEIAEEREKMSNKPFFG